MSLPPRRSRFNYEGIGDVVVTDFIEKKILDESAQVLGEDGLFRLVDELCWRKVLVKFDNLEYMSSAVMGKLITMHRKLQAVQGKLVLCNIAPSILEVFRITKINKLLAIVTGPNLVHIEDIINEAFGNPYRAAFASQWRTSTAVAIARGVDESRDLGTLPILADALQDAGCDNEEVLGVCRTSHVRGYWVVDLLLGKV